MPLLDKFSFHKTMIMKLLEDECEDKSDKLWNIYLALTSGTCVGSSVTQEEPMESTML